MDGDANTGLTWDDVRRLAMELPGAEEGTSYRTPAMKVRGKLFARLKEDGETVVLRVNFHERALLLEAEPDVFYITDHYRDYPDVLVRLPAVSEEVMRARLEDSWRLVAPPKLVAQLDAAPRD